MDVNFHQTASDTHVRIGYHNNTYKGMIATGSSINIIRENFENLEEKEEDLTVHTIKEAIKLKKSIIMNPTSVCPSVQKFYVHKIF